MSDIGNISGFVEMDIGGVNRKFSKIKLKMLAEWENWARNVRLKIALDALPLNNTSERMTERNMIMIDLTAPTYINTLREMQTANGLHRLLYIAAREMDGKITESDVWEMLDVLGLDGAAQLLESLQAGMIKNPTSKTAPENTEPNTAK